MMPDFLSLFLKKFTVSFFTITIIAYFAALIGTATTVNAQGEDTIPPTTTYSLNPNTPDGNNNWYITPVQVQLNATDLESGIKKINYKINNGNWVTVDFSGTQNLAPNPSFETSGSTSTGAASWEATVQDPEGTYSRDNTNYAPGYSLNSAKIVADGGTWHGINHKDAFAPSIPFDNMTASAWVKTQNATGSVYFTAYAVIPDGSGGYTYQQLAQSSAVSGTNDWTLLTLDFTVNANNATGVYLDLGISGPGTVWWDAVTLTTSLNNTSTSFTVATDSTAHQIEFYSEDFAGNVESSSCVDPKANCIEFKLDQTPPGNWSGSGAVRSPGGGSNAEHELWVFTNVEDATSGLSTNSDQYQYHTSKEPGFGYFSNLIACNSTWNENQWRGLEEYVTTDGVNTAFLKTPKTDFCDSNWKICKDVRFYAEDMAGNIRTKDLCLNGPWIKVRGGGIVRSNAYIDMVAEANEPNTDGLIEVNGISIDFFTSENNWKVYDSPNPAGMSYDNLYALIKGTKTTIATTGNLVSATGVYEINGNYTITNQKTPNNYNTAVFDQIVFVNGNLTISNDINTSASSTALFVVNGNVNIDEKVENIKAAIIADGNIATAYNLDEGKSTKTLNLNGFYVADDVNLQRTLQGTQNNDTPSENFVYEPKYIIQMRQFFETSTVKWVNR